MTEEMLGCRVEKVSEEPGRIGYRLHGPRVVYQLVRRVTDHHTLYVLNSRGHVANIKGTALFTDAAGRLERIRS